MRKTINLDLRTVSFFRNKKVCAASQNGVLSVCCDYVETTLMLDPQWRTFLRGILAWSMETPVVPEFVDNVGFLEFESAPYGGRIFLPEPPDIEGKMYWIGTGELHGFDVDQFEREIAADTGRMA